MADLDDFFKKRDKKKKPAAKSKFSVLDTEEFAKQLEATTIRGEVDGEFEGTENVVNGNAVVNEEPTERRDPLASRDTNARDEVQDEEWKPFDSDENKDYSGLRINIQNWKVEDEENNFEEENDENEKKAACPWGAMRSNKNEQDAENNEDRDEESQSAEKTESTTNETSKPETLSTSGSVTAALTQPAAPATGAYLTPAQKRQLAAGGGSSAAPAAAPAGPTVPASASAAYVPPSMRGKTDSSSGGGLAGSVAAPPRRQKAQPNINDTMEFPTLDNAVDDSTAQNDKITNGDSNEKFELAKKGARVDTKSTKSNQIDLENKFGALDASNQ